MALFYEPTDQYAQKVLDGADIVREAIFRQLFDLAFSPSVPFFGGDLPDFGW